MSNQDNINMQPLVPDIMTAQPFPMANTNAMPYPMANANAIQPFPQENLSPIMENNTNQGAVYPEIYYKLKPFVSAASDMLKTTGNAMPSQQQLEDISDHIYNEFSKMHPDMADYMKKPDDGGTAEEAVPAIIGFGGGFYPGFRGGMFRRRGLGRDLIGALLLAELLGGGRHHRYNPYDRYYNYY